MFEGRTKYTETTEEREIRLRKDRERKRAERKAETAEERAERLAKQRQYYYSAKTNILRLEQMGYIRGERKG